MLFAPIGKSDRVRSSMHQPAAPTGFDTIRQSRLPRFTSAALPITALLIAVIAASSPAIAQTAGTFQVTNILSDGFVPATTMDPGFVDPWGVSGGNTLWIDTAVTGFSYLTSIAGVFGPFKAIVPPASGTGTGQPTGTVQVPTAATGFILSNAAKASFLFATLDGTISGWNGGTSATGNHALIAINNSSQNAVYTDLALVTNTTGSFLLAPNFGQGGKVEIYNTSFAPATLAGTFTDPNIPTGYAPYSIKVLGTQVFVTYMLRTTPPFATGAGSYQEILGTNTGFVSVFDVNGNFVTRVVTGGNLNSPWGVAIAPAGFGIYGGDLLIGNFGDGFITAYSPTPPYNYLGMVADSTGKAISYPGLWEVFVSSSTAANPNSIYFTAGLAQETHGLFGVINNSTTATSTPTFNVSASSQVVTVGVGASANLTISVAPTNSFAGPVTLACTGLPTGATCAFSPASLTVAASAPSTTTLTIQTSIAHGYVVAGLDNISRGGPAAVGFALMLPFGGLLALRRSRRFAALRILGVMVVLLASSALVVGCGSSTPGTPLGTSNLTVTATSGSITQSFNVAMTVK
jgi:uncharacterized protein (TIGR03118 family)